MKKFYVSLAASLMLLVPAAVNAQDGTSCDNAQPFTGMLMGSMIKGTTWYTVTVNELSMFPGSVVNSNQAELVIFEGCDGKEAISNGENCYFLYPGVEYKMRITPKENVAAMLIMGGTPLGGAPEGMYCVKPIDLTATEGAVKQKLGRTLWYKKDFAYNGKLNITKDGINPPSSYLTKVEVRNGDGSGVPNIGKQTLLGTVAMAPAPFVKSGVNLIAITFDADPSGTETEGQFILGQRANTDCANRPERMSNALSLGASNSVENGYYVNDWTFTPTETGTYTFTCYSAEGTVFNVGTIEATGEKRNPGTEYETDVYACKYELSEPVLVSSDNTASIVLNLTAGTKYVVHYDADYALEGEGNTPYVNVVKGTTGIDNVTQNKTDVLVSENPTDGTFTVSSYLLSHGAEIALYDMAAKKVFSAKAYGGSSEQDVQLYGVKAGTYLLVVYGANRSACTKLIVK